MKIQSNVFFISVMILALITSPLSFSGLAFAQEESIGISDTLEVELVHADEEEEVELEGTINGDPVFDDETHTSGSFTLEVDGVTITIVFNVDTEFDDLVADDLAVDLEVEVEGMFTNGDFLATEIELVVEELEGTINGDPVFDDETHTSGSFTLEVDGVTITIVFNVDTEFDDLVADDLAVDLEVEVEGMFTNGDFLATEIELKEEEEEEEEAEEGSSVDKITICHIPPGNPSKAHTITVGGNADNAHLAHGDYLGPCDGHEFTGALSQQVSNFVYESRDLFEEQEKETKDVIAQCRMDMQNAEPSERKSVREDCKSNLKDIRESYKSLRETYRETYKAFGEDMKVFVQESKGLPIDDSTRDAAIANIESLSDSDEYTELQQNIDEEVTVDKHELRKQMKKDRKIAREEMKNLREAAEDTAEAAKDAAEAAEDAAEAAKDAAEAAEDPAEIAEAEEVAKEAKKDQREAEEVAKKAKKDREIAREAAKEQREAAKEQREAAKEAKRSS